MFSRRTLLTTAMAISAVGCSPRSQGATSIRIGHADNEQSTKHLAFVHAQQQLAPTAGASPEFSISIFPSGQLGSERELVEQTQRGAIQITSISNGTLVPFAERFTVLDVPFQFDSYNQAKTVLGGADGRALLGSLESAGLVGLGYWIQGYRHLTTRSRAVRTVSDLRGLKIRTMQAPLHIVAFEALGAVPVPMAWSEVYSGLQQGVIDGQENPLSVIYDEQLYRVQANVTLTGHILDPMPVIANKQWFDALPSARKEALVSAFDAATAYQLDLAERAETEYLGRLRTTTINIIELSTAAKQDFRSRAQPAVVQRIAEQIGQDAIEAWMRTVEASR